MQVLRGRQEQERPSGKLHSRPGVLAGPNLLRERDFAGSLQISIIKKQGGRDQAIRQISEPCAIRLPNGTGRCYRLVSYVPIQNLRGFWWNHFDHFTPGYRLGMRRPRYALVPLMFICQTICGESV